MFISIIIATYNAASTLARCLDSIIPQLTDECELIVIDGNSSDSTNAIIKSYNEISYSISEPDKGIYDAWNKGITVAKGKWVMFIGADDILLPDALQTYLEVIENTDVEDIDYICAQNEYVDKNGKLLKLLGTNANWKGMRKMMLAAHVASLHNRNRLFESIGSYNLNYKICADYELLLRKGSQLKLFFIPKRIARMEVGGMSFSTKAIVETYKIRKEHKSVSPVLNSALFFRDWIAYKLFIFRNHEKRLNLSRIVSYLKGEEFTLDKDIPSSYLLRFFTAKVIALIYGMIRLRTFHRVFIHPQSTIKCSSMIKVGKNFSVTQGCYIDALSHEGLVCGNNVSLGYCTHIELTGNLKFVAKGITIGNNVGLGTHGHYGSGLGGLKIGDDTIMGNYVSFHPENHNFDRIDTPIRLQGVNHRGIKIGNNCWIGAKVTVLDGTELGNGCIVAAGAVVVGIFPDNCIIGGIPAKILKYRTNDLCKMKNT